MLLLPWTITPIAQGYSWEHRCITNTRGVCKAVVWKSAIDGEYVSNVAPVSSAVDNKAIGAHIRRFKTLLEAIRDAEDRLLASGYQFLTENQLLLI